MPYYLLLNYNNEIHEEESSIVIFNILPRLMFLLTLFLVVIVARKSVLMVDRGLDLVLLVKLLDKQHLPKVFN